MGKWLNFGHFLVFSERTNCGHVGVVYLYTAPTLSFEKLGSARARYLIRFGD